MLDAPSSPIFISAWDWQWLVIGVLTRNWLIVLPIYWHIKIEPHLWKA